MPPIILNKDEILKLLDFDEIMQAIEASFVAFAQGKAMVPPPQDIELVEAAGLTHVKSAAIKGFDSYCVKIASGFSKNPQFGLSSSQGLMILLDAKTGATKAILLEEGCLTDYRTAAAGAVAAKHLARHESKTALIVGTGIQARLQAKFLARCIDLKKIKIWGRSGENLSNYLEEMREQLQDIQFEGDIELRHLFNEKIDIIVTTTPSREPIIKNEWVQAGTHINAIGSDMPYKQELDAAILERALVYPDSTEQCAIRGELHHAIAAGLLSKNDVRAELGQMLQNKSLGRKNQNEITIFDSTGVGTQDLAIADYVFRKASRKLIFA